jgi:hypothetical protein
MVIGAAAVLVAAIGMALFVVYVLPILLFVGIIIYLNSDGGAEPIELPNLENDEVCRAVTQFMFHAISSVCNVLAGFLHAPGTVSDIYDIRDFRDMSHRAIVLKLRLWHRQPISPDDCHYIRNALQGGVDGRLQDGYLSGYVWAVPLVGDVPLIRIASVEPTSNHVQVTVLLTNKRVSVEAARLSDVRTPPPGGGDSNDPLFE